MNYGKFVISLDFELMWGVRDKKNKTTYGENILGVHQALPEILKVFRQYDVKATFSTVGFLFFETKKDLLSNLPSLKPEYNDSNLSPYNGYFDQVGEDYKSDKYNFATELLLEIEKYPEQEIGTHTFSHYYCLEPGQTPEAFRADIEKAISAAEKKNIKLTSLVFPRNQFNEQYLKVCSDLGIICYRGNEHSWLYDAKNAASESHFRRALRLLDAYINISGHNCYADEYIGSKTPFDIPSSRFLRPYSKKLSLFDSLRLKRITSGMTYAAKHNLTYHLWWHPHNFGANQKENFIFLEKILQHYSKLNREHNLQSINMSELAIQLKKSKGK
ncbi:MAG: polysaccharide deacetylase family protein [Bacteroidetes bacterium]|jgi:peptidoglycan/xylan/chitin deacetylase (PgdA/CDA1 family)|nr:polysaccharide deacetylase family protein [Bacteroidota bacterium]